MQEDTLGDILAAGDETVIRPLSTVLIDDEDVGEIRVERDRYDTCRTVSRVCGRVRSCNEMQVSRFVNGHTILLAYWHEELYLSVAVGIIYRLHTVYRHPRHTVGIRLATIPRRIFWKFHKRYCHFFLGCDNRLMIRHLDATSLESRSV